MPQAANDPSQDRILSILMRNMLPAVVLVDLDALLFIGWLLAQ